MLYTISQPVIPVTIKLLVENLTKTYSNGRSAGEVNAVNGGAISVELGLFGLLSSNGAGKSSLMRTIATLQSPDGGQVVLQDVGGQDIDVVRQPDVLRRLLGYLPQVHPL